MYFHSLLAVCLGAFAAWLEGDGLPEELQLICLWVLSRTGFFCKSTWQLQKPSLHHRPTSGLHQLNKPILCCEPADLMYTRLCNTLKILTPTGPRSTTVTDHTLFTTWGKPPLPTQLADISSVLTYAQQQRQAGIVASFSLIYRYRFAMFYLARHRQINGFMHGQAQAVQQS